MNRLKFFGRLLIGLAAGLALLVSLYILLAPLNIQTISATAIAGEPANSEILTIQQSWFQVQGYWGVLILIVFAVLYGWGYWLAQKESYSWLVILSLGLVFLSFLALTVALLGPWAFDVVHVPAEYPCAAPFIRLEGDFCGTPLPGIKLIGFSIGMLYLPAALALLFGAALLIFANRQSLQPPKSST